MQHAYGQQLMQEDRAETCACLPLLLQGGPASSHYAIIINALHPAQASTYSNSQRTLSNTLPEDLLPYGHMISPFSFSANGSTNPSITHSWRSTGTISNDLSRSSASFTRVKKLWSSCKNKLRKLASKHTTVSQSDTEAFAKYDTQQLGLSDSHLKALRAHAPSRNKSWGNSSSTSRSASTVMTDMTNSSVSSRQSSYSSSDESSVSVDCNKGMQQSVLGSSPGCLVLTPKALSDQTEHWQHAVKAMGALSNWWKL